MATKKMKHLLANEIAEAIRELEFPPGQWLRHVDIEERFGASRTDVRGALEELAVRQTIEHIPNRGYRVFLANSQTYRHIAETRILLESGAAPTIVVEMDRSAVEKLREHAQAFSAAVTSGTREELSRTNDAFHRFMYGFCRNPVLEELILSLRDRSRGAGGVGWQSHEALVQSDADHCAMVEALAERDASRLGRLITAHIAKGIPKKL